MAHYLDTSALVKLVVAEVETQALRDWLAEEERVPVTSDLTRTEMMRTVRRAAADRLVLARAVLDSVIVLTLPTAIYETAGRLEPLTIRSLDAVHLAAALELGDDLDGVVTYDRGLAEGAQANGVPVVAPA